MCIDREMFMAQAMRLCTCTSGPRTVTFQSARLHGLPCYDHRRGNVAQAAIVRRLKF